MNKNIGKALGFVVIGIALAATGIYVGDTDDAPGAALLGILLAIGMVTLGVRTVRRGNGERRKPGALES